MKRTFLPLLWRRREVSRPKPLSKHCGRTVSSLLQAQAWATAGRWFTPERTLPPPHGFNLAEADSPVRRGYDTFPEPPRKLAEYSEAERQLYAQRKAICAQLDGDATQKAFGLQREDGFRPSVPFVASASAALVIAQALKATLWPDKEPGHQMQIESLFLGFSTAQRLR